MTTTTTTIKMTSTISTEKMCWDCEEAVATHGHFCEDCDNEPIMFRDLHLVKVGVCRLCAEDDDKQTAIGSYGEDNVPMCEFCKEVNGPYNSDGTTKEPGNDSDEE